MLKLPDTICAAPKCGQRFTPQLEWQLYCSDACSQRAYRKRKTARLEAEREEYRRLLAEKQRVSL
jgi:hypothetical protein